MREALAMAMERQAPLSENSQGTTRNPRVLRLFISLSFRHRFRNPVIRNSLSNYYVSGGEPESKWDTRYCSRGNPKSETYERRMIFSANDSALRSERRN
jgi:hypothetical protein